MCGPERRRRGGIALWRQPAEVHRRPGVRARSGTGRGDAPDAGVDIGSTEFLHDRLLELRTEGKAVLLVSSKLDEVQGLSDRLAVIHEGEFTGVVDPATVTEEEIGLLMAGETLDDDSVEGLRSTTPDRTPLATAAWRRTPGQMIPSRRQMTTLRTRRWTRESHQHRV